MALIDFPATFAGGRLVGLWNEGVLRFAGIPYAVPPVGPRRFAAPEPAEPWTGERDARRFGARPIQRVAGREKWVHDEDCLTLNVQTRSLEGHSPVLVWIHGGGFTGGAGSDGFYDGQHLVENGDLVVVTINYRLGAFGWLLPPPGSPPTAVANAGLLDQLLALRWVQEHIASFGGDPGNVTVAGQSAGAMSISALLTLPAADGLFHRAICQSGGPDHVVERADAEVVAERLLARAGVTTIEELSQVDATELAVHQDAVIWELGKRWAGRPRPSRLVRFGVVVDGEVVTEHPLDVLAAGRSARVPLLVGHNKHEWSLIGGADWNEDEARSMAESTGLDLPADLASPDEERAKLAFTAVMTEVMFAGPARHLATLHATGTGCPTFRYQFDWQRQPWPGAHHSLEVPYVFDTHRQRLVSLMFTGDATSQALRSAMHRAWIAFMRTGDPNLPDLPYWPPVESGAFMHLDDELQVDVDRLG